MLALECLLICSRESGKPLAEVINELRAAVREKARTNPDFDRAVEAMGNPFDYSKPPEK
jgi:hypothetical protein